MKQLFALVIIGVPIVFVACLLLNSFGRTSIAKKAGLASLSVALIVMSIREFVLIGKSCELGSLVATSSAGSLLSISKSTHPSLFYLALMAESVCSAAFMVIGLVGLKHLFSRRNF